MREEKFIVIGGLTQRIKIWEGFEMKKVFVVILVVLFMVCATATSYAGTWFTGTIDKVLVKGDGTVEITLDVSGTPKWGRINAVEWQAFLATALTAEANNSTVRMNKVSTTWTMIEIQN